MSRTNTPDVIVIGGGAVGCAIAWELARRGLRTTVLERGTPGREATWAAGGMLSPIGEAGTPGAFLDLGLASLNRYPEFTAAIHETTGLNVEHLTSGKLEISLDDPGTEALDAQLEWRRGAGYSVERLDGDAARRLEPELACEVRAALFIPQDHQVNNRRLGRALWLAAARAGAEFRLGVPAVGIRSTGSGMSTVASAATTTSGAARSNAAADGWEAPGRVTGVALADGTGIAAGSVVVAAGCWSAQLAGLPRALPVAPVRGQMVAVETIPHLLQRVILSIDPHCYLIPRSSGRILIGATVEQTGFRNHPTPAGVHSLLEATIRAVPALAAAPLVETWSGLRPGTPDDLPILGSDPAMEGLFYATGHFRNGILLTPITAEVVADLITGRTAGVNIDAFAVERFARAGAGMR